MQLDQLLIETRIRTAWSSIDLGVKLARLHWLQDVFLWLLMAVPIYALCIVIFSGPNEWIAGTIIWWLKPLFERPILYRQSRELFSQATSISQTIAGYKDWFWPGILPALSYRRLSFSRSFLMAVLVLEKLKGAAYTQRTNVLKRKFSSEATWLTVVFVHFEFFFSFSIIMLVGIIAPDLISFEYSLAEASQSATLIWGGTTLFVMAAIAPFYVTSGFTLYISRRVELEGWDIEISFRDWLHSTEKRSLMVKKTTK